MNNEMYELVNKQIKTGDLKGKAWRYTKNLSIQKDNDHTKEKNMLLATISGKDERFEKFVIEVADLAHHITQISRVNGKILSDDMDKLVRRADLIMKHYDIEICDPTGKKLDDDILDKVNIVNNIEKPDISDHLVGETIETVISLNGKILRTGKVIGWYPENEKSQERKY